MDILINLYILTNQTLWNIYLMIVGPKGTPYEDGMLFFHLKFSDKYPYEPPSVKFLNKIIVCKNSS